MPFGNTSSRRPDIKQASIFLILLVCATMSADANAAQPDEIFVMRMHFECGWLEQFATGDQETVTEAAENHIVLGSELAADLGLGREELAGEVAASSRRVLAEKDNIDHLERRLIECRRNTYEN